MSDIDIEAAELASVRQTLRRVCEERDRLRAEVERLQEALTPSGATKAAYIGEFHFTDSYIGEDGNDVVRKVAVPWTTVKEIMVAIRARAALTTQEKDTQS